MKIKLAILEKDESYLSRITTVFNNKYTDKLEVYAFTDLKVAMENLQTNKIDVFIANDAFCIDITMIPKRCGFAYFVDAVDIETFLDQRTICKFQKADLIYKEVLSIYAECAVNATGYKLDDNSSVSILTFVSASGGVGSSTIAASCAISLAQRRKKVLYLNLEHLGNSNLFFQAEGQFDFSDVIYAIISKKSNLVLKLESTVKQDSSGVYFYDPCKSALDILDMKKEDLQRLITELKMTGLYEYIVIDMDFAFDKKSLEILKSSRSIVFVSDGTEVSNMKFNRAIQAISIIEEQMDTSFVQRIALVYNKFSNKTSKAIENTSIVELGGVQKFENASMRQVIDQITATQVFDKLFA